MDISYKQNSVIIKNVKNFDIVNIFECGQCFRWQKFNDNSYIGVVDGKVMVVEQREDEVEFHNTRQNEFRDFWMNYFDLDRDYDIIKNILRSDDVLSKAIEFGDGIRILNQDIWECLISFIISANNRIPMIKKSVEKISKNFGKKLEFNNCEYYTFPTPQKLKDVTEEDLQNCGVGFRAKYIKSVVHLINNGVFSLEEVKKMDTASARGRLQELPGVGPKIADCVLLFSAKKHDVFPTDVWVKRVMEYFYSSRELKIGEIHHIAHERFGDLAGFAQQYLFYYARELKIGK